MRKVKNKQVIRRLSSRILSSKRSKNAIGLAAILLTTILFTTVFSVCGNLLRSQTESTFRQVGGNTHAGFKNFTMTEYEQMKDDPKIHDVSYNIFVGNAVNPELNKLQSEVRYYEPLNAQQSFACPTTGNLPEKQDEIAMSTLILDELGIPHELGQEVTLNLNIHNEIRTDTFTLCADLCPDRRDPERHPGADRASQFCQRDRHLHPLPQAGTCHDGICGHDRDPAAQDAPVGRSLLCPPLPSDQLYHRDRRGIRPCLDGRRTDERLHLALHPAAHRRVHAVPDRNLPDRSGSVLCECAKAAGGGTAEDGRIEGRNTGFVQKMAAPGGLGFSKQKSTGIWNIDPVPNAGTFSKVLNGFRLSGCSYA